MKASAFFKRSPMFDSYEVIRVEERTCARCEEIDGHKPGCVEPIMQKLALELIPESPERMRREKGEIL